MHAVDGCALGVREVAGEAGAPAGLAGHHGNALRHADGGVGVALSPGDALVRELVEMGRHDGVGTAVWIEATDTVAAPLVGGDEDQVGAVVGDGKPCDDERTACGRDEMTITN